MLQPTHVAIIESWLGHMQRSNCCVQHHIWNDQCYLNVPGIPSDFHMVQHIYKNAPLVAKSDNLLLLISSFSSLLNMKIACVLNIRGNTLYLAIKESLLYF